ncbi:MAG: VanZ family protein, partial [Clostridia bacterium]|nr:VanZ family protein [Clostridia bacterium]
MKLLLRISIRISPFLYMGLIWFLSSHPSDAIIDTGFSFDSLLKEALHLIEFAILYILLIMAILTFGELASGASRLAAIWAIAYGFLDEFHQYFVPSRSATVIDLVKDTVGVLIVYYLVKKYYFGPRDNKISVSSHRIAAYLSPNARDLQDME